MPNLKGSNNCEGCCKAAAVKATQFRELGVRSTKLIELVELVYVNQSANVPPNRCHRSATLLGLITHFLDIVAPLNAFTRKVGNLPQPKSVSVMYLPWC